MSRSSRFAIAIAAVTGLAACQSSSGTVDGQPAPGMAFADADVAGVLETANDGEVQAAEVALERASDSRVRDFAQRMVTDHTNASERLAQLASTGDIMIGNPSLAAQLRSSNTETVQTLQQLEGAAFDRTYMDSQVSMHEWLLNTIDNTLIPSTRDNDLESLLTDIRPAVAQHLESARQIRSSLGN